jgi:transcription-repair coupling factor (superfamily II helicase)
LASHDLDQRGAGNLLGDEQSGHIKEIGFELYQSMLEEAILEARAEAAGMKPPAEAFSPQITAEVPILIPDHYVPDLNVRMALYRRLNEIDSRAGIDSLAAEIIDRFGKLPSEVENLLSVIEIKQACITAGIAKLEAGRKGGLVTFRDDRFANPDALMDYIARLGERAKVRPDQKLFIAAEWGDDRTRLKGALAIASALSKLAAGAKLKPVAKPTAKPLPPPKAPMRPAVFKSKFGKR